MEEASTFSAGSISISALELLGMVVSACMLAVVPVGEKGCMLLRGDNEAAVLGAALSGG